MQLPMTYSSPQYMYQALQPAPHNQAHNPQAHNHVAPHNQAHNAPQAQNLVKNPPGTNGNGPAQEQPKEIQSQVDFHKVDSLTLKRYKRHYKLRTKHNSTKSELAAAVGKHFSSLQTGDPMETISFFIYAVKNQEKVLKLKEPPKMS